MTEKELAQELIVRLVEHYGNEDAEGNVRLAYKIAKLSEIEAIRSGLETPDKCPVCLGELRNINVSTMTSPSYIVQCDHAKGKPNGTITAALNSWIDEIGI